MRNRILLVLLGQLNSTDLECLLYVEYHPPTECHGDSCPLDGLLSGASDCIPQTAVFFVLPISPATELSRLVKVLIEKKQLSKTVVLSRS